MITGFNTDVNFDGVTYHVQTEDKGLDTPLILSLVYQHGTILASKRSSYQEMLGAGFDEQELEKRLQHQHKLMCAAVRTGRIEDLKRMTAQNAAGNNSIGSVLPAPPEAGVVEKPKVGKLPLVENDTPEVFEKAIPKPPEPALIEPEVGIVKDTKDLHIPSPDLLKENDLASNSFANSASDQPELEPPSDEQVWDVPITEGIEIIEDDDFFDEGFVLSPDAIQVVDDFSSVTPAIDEELHIKFLAEYVFRAGEKKNVNILVSRGEREKEVENASVMIKVLGASFRPMIFHAKTDKHGVATVFVKLPMFRSGRAAILVRASTGNEETELRKVIEHQ